jgi:hypothetical protein
MAHPIWSKMTRSFLVQNYFNDQIRRFLGENSLLVFRETVG